MRRALYQAEQEARHLRRTLRENEERDRYRSPVTPYEMETVPWRPRGRGRGRGPRGRRGGAVSGRRPSPPRHTRRDYSASRHEEYNPEGSFSESKYVFTKHVQGLKTKPSDIILILEKLKITDNEVKNL